MGPTSGALLAVVALIVLTLGASSKRYGWRAGAMLIVLIAVNAGATWAARTWWCACDAYMACEGTLGIPDQVALLLGVAGIVSIVAAGLFIETGPEMTAVRANKQRMNLLVRNHGDIVAELLRRGVRVTNDNGIVQFLVEDSAVSTAKRDAEVG